jgi:hypothetical protein
VWSKLDDALIDHRKVFAAGGKLGKDGAAVALGFYAVALMWSNKHLTDGFIPSATISGFRHVSEPKKVAEILAKARLFDRVSGGFRVHDFADYNPSADRIKKWRRAERLRKQRDRASGNGHKARR